MWLKEKTSLVFHQARKPGKVCSLQLHCILTFPLHLGEMPVHHQIVWKPHLRPRSRSWHWPESCAQLTLCLPDLPSLTLIILRQCHPHPWQDLFITCWVISSLARCTSSAEIWKAGVGGMCKKPNSVERRVEKQKRLGWGNGSRRGN